FIGIKEVKTAKQQFRFGVRCTIRIDNLLEFFPIRQIYRQSFITYINSLIVKYTGKVDNDVLVEPNERTVGFIAFFNLRFLLFEHREFHEEAVNPGGVYIFQRILLFILCSGAVLFWLLPTGRKNY